ncbi:MAG: twin-arginine translocation signal domain-containing protein [Proteobacteria bacterium]|nr:twin-arginine translocation signal domain-containing protein [Pseudomonadota bacterium]
MSVTKKNPDSSRRSFIATAAVAASAALVGLKSHSARAAGENLPHLSESDPLAKSLGYQMTAQNVDKSKFPTYKPGERCADCRFFQGTAGEKSGFGGCQIFAGYSVSADGWCASFNARS